MAKKGEVEIDREKRQEGGWASSRLQHILQSSLGDITWRGFRGTIRRWPAKLGSVGLDVGSEKTRPELFGAFALMNQSDRHVYDQTL